MSEPKMIYLATRGDYSDYRVLHAFTRREDAEAYPLGDEVEERVLREGPVEVRDWHTLNWDPDRPETEGSLPFSGNPFIYCDRRDFDGDERHVVHDWSAHVARLTVQGWDRERVLKVYSEQRAQHIARKEGVS